MSEEYGNDFVTLIDEDGNEVEFEHIDTVEYEGVTYLAFIRRSCPLRRTRRSSSCAGRDRRERRGAA
ncbi:MAG: DUF1292 domain-containing protein [Butyricicoccaceae bacterium]